MSILTENVHTGEHVLSEAGGQRSREKVTVTGGDYAAGTVLGKITLGSASAVAGGGNTGDGTIGAITVGASAQAGDYVLTITEAAVDGGTFQVVDPQGDVVGIGTVGTEFTGGGLTFTLSDGATDFVVGDTFTITVAAGSGKYTLHDPAATDGSQTAAAVLYDATDASAADQDAVVHLRDCELDGDLLTWKTGIAQADKDAAIAALAGNHVIVR